MRQLPLASTGEPSGQNGIFCGVEGGCPVSGEEGQLPLASQFKQFPWSGHVSDGVVRVVSLGEGQLPLASGAEPSGHFVVSKQFPWSGHVSEGVAANAKFTLLLPVTKPTADSDDTSVSTRKTKIIFLAG